MLCSQILCPFLAVYQEFDRLLEEQSPIEAYIEWLDSMVDRCVVKVRQQQRFISSLLHGSWMNFCIFYVFNADERFKLNG